MERKTFTIIDWIGKRHRYKAETIYRKVMNDINKEYRYNWFARVGEIVKVCDKEGFPKNLALEMKVGILNSFAKMYSDDLMYIMRDDVDDVKRLFNMLRVKNEHNIPVCSIMQAKQNFLTAVINHAVDLAYSPPFHKGDNYKKIVFTWKDSEFNYYLNDEVIDFDAFEKKLISDLHFIIEKANEEGFFSVQDEKSAKNFTRLVPFLNNHVSNIRSYG